MIILKKMRIGAQDLWSSVLRPAAFYTHVKNQLDENADGAQVRFLTRAALALLELMIVCVIVLVFSASVSQEQIAVSLESMDAYLEADALVPVFGKTNPWEHLLFPVSWALIICYDTILRYATGRMLGDIQVRFRSMLAVCMLAATPLIVMGTCIAVYNNLFPFTRLTGGGAGWRILIQWLLLVGAFIYEAYLCVQAFRILFRQNSGRAVFTWLAPTVFFVVFVIGFFTISNLLRNG
ncbi:MAG: hypothetical protein KDK30_09785 [Leptospiraceae bacterium]|nr:hypothetical protein [Leptospiraceae bacterium]MCB1316162.1 hypothetical protein [Leptospiraceae bacterium]MCB1323231.1 hypothetical protein [Leptospiraceae bacterium]